MLLTVLKFWLSVLLIEGVDWMIHKSYLLSLEANLSVHTMML